MVLSLRVRDVLLATWEVEREQVARTLPPGVRPAAVDGRHLVSIAALRYGGGRLGGLPVAPFSQLNLCAYVEHGGKPAVLFLLARVSAAGMLGAFLGAPYRPARLRFARGSAEAPGLGVRLAYELRGPAERSALTEHTLGLFEAAGLRAFTIRRGPDAWQQADLLAPPRADPLAALGFDLSAPPALLYAESAKFEAEVPPSRVA